MSFQCYECHHKRGTCKYHEDARSPFSIGSHEAWPGIKVWLPTYGVSVGHCERCEQHRPCVNC